MEFTQQGIAHPSDCRGTGGRGSIGFGLGQGREGRRHLAKWETPPPIGAGRAGTHQGPRDLPAGGDGGHNFVSFVSTESDGDGQRHEGLGRKS
jgi:hypothetical protein